LAVRRRSQAIAESVEFMRSAGMLDNDARPNGSGTGSGWRVRVLVTAAAVAAAAALVYWWRLRSHAL
jgi:hypothetical protein